MVVLALRVMDNDWFIYYLSTYLPYVAGPLRGCQYKLHLISYVL